jgi:hypothetical protein
MTSSDSRALFLWSDAWILMAIAVASPNAPAQLAEIMEIADGINHALLTREELNGAIGRLGTAALVQSSDVGYSVSAAGRTMYDAATARSRSLIGQLEVIQASLGARPSRDGPAPADAQMGEPQAVSEADYSRALATLHSRTRSRS